MAHILIRIELGNDAMETGLDVVKALVKNRLNAEDPNPLEIGEAGRIFDENGNRVGSWKVEDDD